MQSMEMYLETVKTFFSCTKTQRTYFRGVYSALNGILA